MDEEYPIDEEEEALFNELGNEHPGELDNIIEEVELGRRAVDLTANWNPYCGRYSDFVPEIYLPNA